MLDLEDAVAAAEKVAARAIVCESALAAPAGGPLVGVRINSLAHRAHGRRPRRARRRRSPRIALITLPDGRRSPTTSATSPRASTSSSARPASTAGSVALLAMTETARGVLAAREIAAASAARAHAAVRAGRPRQGARHGAHGRRLRAPARALGDRAGGARGRQGGPDRRALPQARRRRGLRRLVGLGAAARLPGQGRAAPAPAADRGRGVRAGRARAGLGARGRPRVQRGRGRRRLLDQARGRDVRRLPGRGSRARHFACATTAEHRILGEP